MSTTSDEKSALKNSSVDILDAGRLRLCLYTLLFGGIWNTLTMLHPWGWPSATMVTAIAMSVMIGYIIIKRDALGQQFMVFSLVAGFVELLADWYLVAVDRSLFYNPNGPFIWMSPFYMPFCWAGNLFIFGVLGRWFDKKWGLMAAIVVTGLLGCIVLPYWEFIAKYAAFWDYRNTLMIGPVPYYIIFGEFFIVAGLPLAFRLVKRFNNWLASIGMGIIFGLWLFVAYWLGIQIFS